MTKSIFSSRTFWLAVAQLVAGIIAIAVAQDPELATVGWISIGKSVIDTILRFATDKPVSV